MFMNNLKYIDYKDLSETEIYILDHSTYKIYDENLINITGTIQEIKPKLKKYTDFELMINLNQPKKKKQK